MSKVKVSFYRIELVKDGEVGLDFDADIILDDQCKMAAFGREAFQLDKQAEEVVGMVTLNNELQPTGLFEVSRGSLCESILHPREIFKRALLSNAHSFVLFHNHPCGKSDISVEDAGLFITMQSISNVMGIECRDIIATGDDGTFQSAAEEQKLAQEAIDAIIEESGGELTQEEAIEKLFAE